MAITITLFFKNCRSLGGVFPFILMCPCSTLALLLLQHMCSICETVRLFKFFQPSYLSSFLPFQLFEIFIFLPFQLFTHSASWAARETVHLWKCSPFKALSDQLLFSFSAFSAFQPFQLLQIFIFLPFQLFRILSFLPFQLCPYIQLYEQLDKLFSINMLKLLRSFRPITFSAFQLFQIFIFFKYSFFCLFIFFPYVQLYDQLEKLFRYMNVHLVLSPFSPHTFQLFHTFSFMNVQLFMLFQSITFQLFNSSSFCLFRVFIHSAS